MGLTYLPALSVDPNGAIPRYVPQSIKFGA
jgi:hypothetical protein